MLRYDSKKRKTMVDEYGLPVNMMYMTEAINVPGSVTDQISNVADQMAGFTTQINGVAAQITGPEDKIDAGDSHANYIELQGTDTGVSPQIKAVGTDTNLDLNLVTKGTGAVKMGSAAILSGSLTLQTSGQTVQTFLNTNNVQTTLSCHNTASGNSDMVIQPEGTGSVVLGNNKPAFARVTPGATGTNVTLEALGETNTGLTLLTAGSGPVTTASQVKITNASDTNSNLTGCLQTTGGVMCGASFYNGGNAYFNRSSTNYLTLQGATAANSPTITAGSQTTTDVSIDLVGKGAGGIHLPVNRNNYFAIDGSSTGTGTVTIAPSVNSADATVDVIVKPKGANGTVRLPMQVGRALVATLSQTVGAGTSATVTLTGISGFPTGVSFDGATKMALSGGTTYTKWYVSAYIRYTFDTVGPFIGRCLLFGDAFTSGYYGDYVQTQVSSTTAAMTFRVHGPFTVTTGQNIWFKFFNDSSAGTATITVADISLHRLAAD